MPICLRRMVFGAAEVVEAKQHQPTRQAQPRQRALLFFKQPAAAGPAGELRLLRIGAKSDTSPASTWSGPHSG